MDHKDSTEYGDETIEQVSVKCRFSEQEKDCYQDYVYEGKKACKKKGTAEMTICHEGMNQIVGCQSHQRHEEKDTKQYYSFHVLLPSEKSDNMSEIERKANGNYMENPPTRFVSHEMSNHITSTIDVRLCK